MDNLRADAASPSEIEALRRELARARREQAASAEILRIVSRSGADASPVFDAILEACLRLFSPYGAAINLVEGEMAKGIARRGFADGDWGTDATPLAGSSTGRAISERRPIHIVDLAEVPGLPEHKRAAVQSYGGLTTLYVPMISGERGVGSLVVARRPKRPFSQAEIASLSAFADQATIAIENARLFEEVKGRTVDLQEALKRQSATAKILEIIASSPSDAQPVFEAIAASANAVVRGRSTGVYRFIDGRVHLMAITSTSPEGDAAMRATFPLALSQFPPFARVSEGAVSEISDTELVDVASFRELARVRGYRSLAFVPLVHRGVILGLLSATRATPGAFAPADVALLRAFADQAVIAIENARLFEEVQGRTRDLEEALAQQTATSDVLRVISRSPSDLKPVLDAIAETAARLCGSEMTMFFRFDGEAFRILASWKFPPDVQAMLEAKAPAPGHPSALGRAGASLKPVYIPDVLAEPGYGLKTEQNRALYRATLAVPMLREGQLVGALSLNRSEPGSFTLKHIALVSTFADQAAIAFENVRLFEEVRARTRDLETALERQTATAEILRAIASSPTDLEPVFDAIAKRALTLCEAENSGVFRLQGGLVDMVGMAGVSQAQSAIARGAFPAPLDRGSASGRAMVTGAVVHIPDIAADPEYALRPVVSAGFRSALSTPMLLKGEAIGAINVTRTQVRPFSSRQIELLQTFAAQAVIAIENARLFNETQEALERQTATAEILKVIASSPSDTQPVFEAIVASAKRLLGARASLLTRFIGDNAHLMAFTPVDPVHDAAFVAAFPRTADDPITQAMLAGRTVLVDDTESDDDWGWRDGAKIGVRSGVNVPLVSHGITLGGLTVNSPQPGAFRPEDVELLRTFADQAVIAIENVRLLKETQEALAQQTATADVLKTISRSAFDLQTVLDTLVESAARLCEADLASINQQVGSGYPIVANFGYSAEFEQFIRRNPPQLGRGSVAGRTVLEGRAVQIADVLCDPEFQMKPGAKAGGTRTMLGVPLLRAGSPIGVLVLSRKKVRPFTAKQVELVETFADQAVIAIENARLFAEVQTRTRELEQSLADLRKAQDRLVQSEKLASLGQLTAGIAHEIKNPLNFVNNFAALSRDLIAEMKQALAQGESARAEVEELTGLIDSNLEKVVHHGQRADSIVKNMLLHSREGSGTRTPVNVNAMVEEALNLAYHGARAEKPGFNVGIEKGLDPRCGEAPLYLQEITRVLLNLISNGFYATAKRREAQEPDYQPMLRASTRRLDDRVEIRIRDNGTGIPENVRKKMFNPFFTTKPAGEGTGLGLSLTHDIVVKQHGGTIEVETITGAFTEFIVTLPLGGAV